MDLEKVYKHRFSQQEVKALAGVWQVLIDDFFSRWIDPSASVLDVGAGYCNFINNVNAARRTAIDANPEVKNNCAEGVDFICASSLHGLRLEKKYDVVFMSNFLEHLNSSDEVLQILECIRPLLNPGGRIIILQPNFALTGSKYFDFIDHKTILTDKSLVEAVELTGFRVEYIKKYFLPYTSKSALPKKPWMVRLYLKLPFLHYLLAGQSIVVAQTLSD